MDGRAACRGRREVRDGEVVVDNLDRVGWLAHGLMGAGHGSTNLVQTSKNIFKKTGP